MTSAVRAAMMPETPTLDELGLKGFDVSTLYGLLAPRGTPEAIVERLSHAMQEIARMPEVRTQLASQGRRRWPPRPRRPMPWSAAK
ncbi:tripartite tricarboxylate transporter substrate-binding protein [Siccirubricoccus deserti]